MSTVGRGSRLDEQDLLGAARSGDEDAFRNLIAPYRAELHAHCYRLLGSLHDAEDALQETLLAAWRGLARFEGRSSLRTWLYKIATNVCLRAIARRPTRLIPVERGAAGDPRGELGEPPAESVWLEPYPDEGLGFDDQRAAPDARLEQREAVELAFVAALQHLPATQRAVLILRDVLGFSAQETAEALETTTASVNSALQRARASVNGRMPERSQQATRRALGEERHRKLVDDFVRAWDAADGIVALLAEDATWAVPPLPTWFRGREDIRVFTAERVFATQRRFVVGSANAQPAMVGYEMRDGDDRFRLSTVNVLTLGDVVTGMTAFIDPRVLARFGLPEVFGS
jgi:RNA polymerase sigma-70 factor (TIGR02960 family)